LVRASEAAVPGSWAGGDVMAVPPSVESSLRVGGANVKGGKWRVAGGQWRVLVAGGEGRREGPRATCLCSLSCVCVICAICAICGWRSSAGFGGAWRRGDGRNGRNGRNGRRARSGARGLQLVAWGLWPGWGGAGWSDRSDGSDQWDEEGGGRLPSAAAHCCLRLGWALAALRLCVRRSGSLLAARDSRLGCCGLQFVGWGL